MSHMRQSSKTQHEILNAAFEVFGRNASAPLSDVAHAAGVGRATLHRYFAGRDDLMAALAKAAMADLNAAVDAALHGAESYLDGLRRAMAASIPLANRQLFLAQEAVDRDPEVAAAYAASTAELLDAIGQAKAEGSLPGAVPTAWVARVYDGLVYAAWEAVVAQELTPTQATDLAWATFLNGMKGAPP
ncbi:MAG: TetR family transcriptional regulator [Pseudomonadota bacterium]